jgi:fructokinase
MALAHVVHCAEEEWEFVTGTTDRERGAHKILDAGPHLVAVTLGARGCWYDDGECRGEVAGFPVEVADPLGAGDAFVAAMLSQLMYQPRGQRLSREQIEEVMTYANAAGALACTRRGVIPALPAASELQEFLASRGA